MYGYEVDRDKYVYHYTSRETAIEYILESFKILANSFLLLNDPKESKNWWFVAEDTEGFTAENSQSLHDAMINSQYLIKDNCKIFCCSRDLPSTGYNPSYLGRGFAKPRMWATYGRNHSGVCFAFDKEKLTELFERHSKATNQRLFHGDVNYVDSEFPYDAIRFSAREICKNYLVVPELLNQKIESLIEEYYQYYFLHKYTDWSSESETRWIIRGSGTNPELIDISEAICGIILGSEFNNVYRPLIKEKAECKNIEVRKLHWRNGVAGVL